MAESLTQIPSPPNVTPKEEPITLDRPESPNPFLSADQVAFNFDEMLFTTNNEVAQIYPDHPNSKYFQLVSDFISKSLESFRIWVSTLTGGVRGEIGVTTFKNAIGAYYIDEYVDSPSLAIVKPWFAQIGYNGEIRVKGILKRAVFLLVVPNVPKATKPSSNAERVPQGTKPGVKPGHKKHSTSLTQPFVSSNEATKGGSSKRPTGSKTGYLKRKKESSSVIDSNPSHTSASTLVVAKMHKEDQQVTSDPNSLGVTNEEGAHPQLSSGMSAFTNIEPVFSASYIFHHESAPRNDVSVDFIAEDDPEIFAPNYSVPHQQGPDRGSKNYTPDNTFAWTNPSVLVDKTKSVGDGSQTAHTISGTKVDTRSAFKDDEDQEDEPFIAQRRALEQDKEKDAAEIDTLKAQFVFPNINQLTEHLVSSMKLEFSKLLSSHDFSSSIPTELKELPIKITALYGEVNELKKHIQEFEIELPKVAELKKHTWELPKEFLDLPGKISSIQTHIKTLEALPGLLNKVTDTLNMFASILIAHNKGVPSAGKSTTSPAEGEKNTNLVIEDAKLANLIDLMGIDVVEEYYKKKEDGSEKVISNLKVSDLHLAEWREVIQACPDKSEKGWKTIYGLVKTREDQLTLTEQELKIDLNKPLKEQDPLNELNELANKKRKKAGNFSDEPKSAKKVKSLVQQ
ncbi:hypothetical protein Tco_0358813 [Tanacetum coccineum]